MNQKKKKLLAKFERLSLRAQQEVIQFVQFLEFKEKGKLDHSVEPQYMAHFEESQGIYLIEDPG